MFIKRTDLALEARELWQESAGKTTRLPGVRAETRKAEGYPVTRVEILDEQGAEALGKPVGTYVTVDLTAYWERRADFFPRAVRAVGGQLKELLPEEGGVLAACLGNAAMTPDALGPLAADWVLATRHLSESLPFAGFRPAAVCRTGVLGTTGIESAEAVRGAAEQVHPAAVIAVDALASRRRARLCSTVQLSDTGILPGSGVGNHRAALNRETLGVPVIAVGVPTVVDAATLAADLLEEAGLLEAAGLLQAAGLSEAAAGLSEAAGRAKGGRGIGADAPRQGHEGLFVTPRDIDSQVRLVSRLLAYGVNLALHRGLTVEDMELLLS